MIIYLCIKYESNTLIFSKNIKQKPYLEVEQEAKWLQHSPESTAVS